MENKDSTTKYPIIIKPNLLSDSSFAIGILTLIFICVLILALGIIAILYYKDSVGYVIISPLILGLIITSFNLYRSKTVFIFQDHIEIKYKFLKSKNYIGNLDNILGFIYYKSLVGEYNNVSRNIVIKNNNKKIFKISTVDNERPIEQILNLFKEKNIKNYSLPNQRSPLLSIKELEKQFI